MLKGDHISNIDDLKRWFDMNQQQQQPKPYFTIWRGTEQKSDRIVLRNTEISDTAAAWDLMEEVLEMHTQYGGLFRIFITDKPAHNVGISTLYKVANPYQMMPQHPQMAGMYNMKMYSAEEVAEREANQRKMWEMERQIEDLRAESQAKVGEMENMMHEFMPVLKDLVRGLGMKMMGYGPQAAPMHQAPPIAGPGYAPAEHSTSEDGYDYDRIEPALDALKGVFPDTETTIEKIARWAQQNPAMAQQLIQNLDA